MQQFSLQKRKYTLWDYPKILFQIAPVSLLAECLSKIWNALFPSMTALTTAHFVDTVTDIFNGVLPSSSIWVPLLLLILLVGINWLQSPVSDFFSIRLKQRATEQFVTALLEKKARLEYTHIESPQSCDLIQRVCGRELSDGNSEYESFTKLYGGWSVIRDIAYVLLSLISLLSIFFRYAWWSVPIILGMTYFVFRLSMHNGKKLYDAKKQVQEDSRKIEYLGDVLRSREYTDERSLFSYHGFISRRIKEHLKTTVKAQEKERLKSILTMHCSTVLSLIEWFAVSAILLPSVGNGSITLGFYIGLLGCTTEIVDTLTGFFNWCAQDLSEQKEYIQDLSAFANLSETPDATVLPAEHPMDVEIIRFENICFSYPGTDKLILDSLNLEIRKGIKYAFVGINGAGKTTITKLLTGLYPNYTGRITINGRELREIPVQEQKALFSVVHQDFARYSISVRDNIALGNVNAMDDTARIENAIHAIHLEEDLSQLPQGLDTRLGRLEQNSQDLSGGQWQRIAIARSAVSNAPVVILDEPTAALDPIAESALYAEFKTISRNKTSIFISHRLGSTKLADRIYVLECGHVAESGTHEELMKQDGLYAQMYHAQKEWYQ